VGGVARNDGYVGGRGIVSICFLNFILGGTIRRWKVGRMEEWKDGLDHGRLTMDQLTMEGG
jgi:hypothetical protein